VLLCRPQVIWTMKSIIFAVVAVMQVGSTLAAGSYGAEKAPEEIHYQMANFAVGSQKLKEAVGTKLTGQGAAQKTFKLKSIDSVQEQVVAGKNYKMTLTLVEDCNDETEECSTMKCHVVVWDKVWVKEGGTQVTEVTCD